MWKQFKEKGRSGRGQGDHKHSTIPKMWREDCDWWWAELMKITSFLGKGDLGELESRKGDTLIQRFHDARE